MRFFVAADRAMTLAFEPTGAEHRLEPSERVLVEWPDGPGDGEVVVEGDEIVVHAPTGGFTRAWEADGVEIDIGPESGPDAR